MSDITTSPTHFYAQVETLTNPNMRLSAPIDIDTLIITLTAPIADEDGVDPNVPFIMVIRNNQTGFPEPIYVQAGELSADLKTVTLAALTQRGIQLSGLNGVDFASGVVGRRSAHPQNSEVRISISPLDFQILSDAQKGVISSGGTSWIIGKGTDVDITVSADNGDANKPFWMYDASANGWVYSNDGVSTQPFGDGSGLTAGDGIAIGGGAVSVDTTDTAVFKNTSAGAGDAGIVPKLDAAGKLDTSIAGATNTEVAQLSGTTNIAEANTFFGATDMSGAEAETLTDGSNANALHVHDSYLHNSSSIVVPSVVTANTNYDLDIDCGFIPRYFECIIDVGVSRINGWASGSSSSLGRESVLVKGELGGILVKVATNTFTSGGTGPSAWKDISPSFLSSQSDSLDVAVASCASPSMSITEPSGSNSMSLTSIVANLNEIQFNFTHTHGSGDAFALYAVRALKVWA